MIEQIATDFFCSRDVDDQQSRKNKEGEKNERMNVHDLNWPV